MAERMQNIQEIQEKNLADYLRIIAEISEQYKNKILSKDGADHGKNSDDDYASDGQRF